MAVNGRHVAIASVSGALLVAGLNAGATPARAGDVPIKTLKFSVLHAFGNATADGWQPWGSPTIVNGQLWGRTTYGGSHKQSAVIWRMDPNKPKTYRIVHRFGGTVKYSSGGTGPDLANPHHDWMRVMPGGTQMVGATLWGGRGGQGGVFEISPQTGGYRVLHAFAGISPTNPAGNPKDGANPHSNAVPIIDVKSRARHKPTILVGMTANGGATGQGLLYQMRTDGSRFRLLHSFAASTGNVPHGFVIQSGNFLYGMTRLGDRLAPESNFPDHKAHKPYAAGNGTIFRFNLKTNKYRVLHGFSYSGPLGTATLPGGVVDGAVPDHGGLILRRGRLWGVTTLGGANGGGVLFSIRPTGTGYRIEHAFGVPTAAGGLAAPHGTLMPGPDGKLYGLAALGGSAKSGGVFSFVPKSAKYKDIYDFNGGNGGAIGEDNPAVTTNRAGNVVLYGMTKMGGRVLSNFTPTPAANDWKPVEPPHANGVIWRLVLPRDP